MIKVGLLSDTHGYWDDKYVEYLDGCDEIWHAGDFGGGFTTAAEIARFKPLVGVCGNCDNYDLRYDYPLHRFFTCGGMKVLMTHIGGYPGKYDRNAYSLVMHYSPDIFVCGHSHTFIYFKPEMAVYRAFHRIHDYSVDSSIFHMTLKMATMLFISMWNGL